MFTAGMLMIHSSNSLLIYDRRLAIKAQLDYKILGTQRKALFHVLFIFSGIILAGTPYAVADKGGPAGGMISAQYLSGGRRDVLAVGQKCGWWNENLYPPLALLL